MDALIRFEHFDRTHKHPAGQDISSQRSSELFQSITEEAKDKFLRLQGKRHIEKEYWAYDTTSISSYSGTLKQVKYGKNKDDGKLPQISPVLLFGEKSGFPFYYRKLAGNTPDVKTMRQLIKDMDVLGYGKIKLCLDRGFYSTDNINGMYKEHYKFSAGASTSLSCAKQFITELGDDIEYSDVADRLSVSPSRTTNMACSFCSVMMGRNLDEQRIYGVGKQLCSYYTLFAINPARHRSAKTHKAQDAECRPRLSTASLRFCR